MGVPLPARRIPLTRTFRTSALAALTLCAIPASAAEPNSGPRWTRVGGTGVAAGFAGPVGGPVSDTWFSLDGKRLYATIRGGLTWASEDLGLSWEAAVADTREPRAQPDPGGPPRGPKVLRNPYRAGVAYALGEHLYRSDDDGHAWENLTAIGGESVIGRWQATLAISPLDPDVIVVGNSMGVWKSYDEGVTWGSLNATLRNFPPARFLPNGDGGPPSLASDALGTLQLVRTAVGRVWRATPQFSPGGGVPPGEAARALVPAPLLPPGVAVTHRVWKDGKPISGDLTACNGATACGHHSISAFATAGTLMWAGTSNGHIWVSADGGRNWDLTWTDPDDRTVTSMWASAAVPSAALATAGSAVLRTTNGGVTWLEIGSGLPESEWSAVRGDPHSGAAYVAGPLGVFHARVDLRAPTPAVRWDKIGGSLPSREGVDLALDPERGRLYVAVPGDGVFWTRAPQVSQALRVLSAADLSERPVAPGSLLTILGASAVRARAGGRPAPILDSGSSQTQLQLPYAVRGRSLRIHLEEPGASYAFDMPLEPVSPAIFVVSGDALALDSGTGALVGWERPARAGGSVLVMAAGLGEVSPAWPAGVPGPERDPPRPLARVTALLNGSPASVLAAHLAPGFVGTYLVEVAIPGGTSPGAAQLSIAASGRPSNTVTLPVGR